MSGSTSSSTCLAHLQPKGGNWCGSLNSLSQLKDNSALPGVSPASLKENLTPGHRDSPRGQDGTLGSVWVIQMKECDWACLGRRLVAVASAVTRKGSHSQLDGTQVAGP